MLLHLSTHLHVVSPAAESERYRMQPLDHEFPMDWLGKRVKCKAGNGRITKLTRRPIVELSTSELIESLSRLSRIPKTY